jgi:nucleoside-diphosphate-sugar epimerase
VLIHLAPLVTLPPLLQSLAGQGPKRVIGFGSTSVFTKARSAYEKERQLAAGLKASEQQIADLGDRHGIRWTVFRPTLVYHLGRDKNVTMIAQFLGKFGFFPLVNGGTGGRQPVHAEDLALATVDAIDNARSFGKAYNLSGGETLSYRNMVIRIAEAIDVPARLVNIPLPLLRGLISFLSLTPRFRLLNPEMANRINQDMCFDNSEAVEELGFAPRAFMREGL